MTPEEQKFNVELHTATIEILEANNVPPFGEFTKFDFSDVCKPDENGDSPFYEDLQERYGCEIAYYARHCAGQYMGHWNALIRDGKESVERSVFAILDHGIKHTTFWGSFNNG